MKGSFYYMFPKLVQINYTFSDNVEKKDTKGVIRSWKSKKDRQHNGQERIDKKKTTKYKTPHSKQNIKQHEPH